VKTLTKRLLGTILLCLSLGGLSTTATAAVAPAIFTLQSAVSSLLSAPALTNDSFSNGGLQGILVDTYTVVANGDFTIRMAGSYANMDLFGPDFFFGFTNEAGQAIANSQMVGLNGSVSSGIFDVTTGTTYQVRFQGTAGGLGGPGSYNVTASVVPIPAAFWLFASALAGLVAVGRRRIGGAGRIAA